MKSSTSWPSSSRKYSATVRPVKPTRARRLVHLPVNEGSLGARTALLDDAARDHLMVK